MFFVSTAGGAAPGSTRGRRSVNDGGMYEWMNASLIEGQHGRDYLIRQ